MITYGGGPLGRGLKKKWKKEHPTGGVGKDVPRLGIATYRWENPPPKEVTTDGIRGSTGASNPFCPKNKNIKGEKHKFTGKRATTQLGEKSLKERAGRRMFDSPRTL